MTNNEEFEFKIEDAEKKKKHFAMSGTVIEMDEIFTLEELKQFHKLLSKFYNYCKTNNCENCNLRTKPNKDYPYCDGEMTAIYQYVKDTLENKELENHG